MEFAGGVAGGQGPQWEQCSHTELGHGDLHPPAKTPRGRLGNKKKLKRTGETLHFGSNSQSREGPTCFGVPSAADRCHQINLDQSELGTVMQRHQIVVNEINLIILELDCPLFSLSSSRGILWSSESIKHRGLWGAAGREKTPSEIWDPTAESLGSEQWGPAG